MDDIWPMHESLDSEHIVACCDAFMQFFTEKSNADYYNYFADLKSQHQ